MTALHVGIDENGLGARLGPLTVTAVMAEVDERGQRYLTKKPRGRLARDLDDSKALVAHGKIAVAEAWARVLTDVRLNSPAEVLGVLCRESSDELQGRCPKAALSQCWTTRREAFQADAEIVKRIHQHRAALQKKGVTIVKVQTEVVCVDRLNAERGAGANRFISDLHAMERLVLSLRQQVTTDLNVVCGKVGGMHDYPSYFGPLAGRLHVVLEQVKRRSTYRFPKLGELSFVQDADSAHALVMLASLVGKYVRELLMERIWHYYTPVPASHGSSRADTTSHDARRGSSSRPAPRSVSGYNDPLTKAFIQSTRLVRGRRGIPDSCFERVGADG